MTPAQVAHIMSLVDEFATDRARAHAGNLYGTSESYTKQCLQSAGRSRAAVEAALRDAPQAEPKRCPYCDDTGDVHSIDGEWRGTCTCPAGKPQQAEGWVMVPVEPTPEMIEAGRRALRTGEKMWPAMLSARPSATTAEKVPPVPTWCEECLSYCCTGCAPTAEPVRDESARITWPKSKDVGRSGDMTPPGQSVLRVGLDSDNDVYVNLWDRGRHEGEFQTVSIEFCNGGGGGGKSPRTRAALINLMTAIEQDNEADPSKDWQAARASKGTP